MAGCSGKMPQDPNTWELLLMNIEMRSGLSQIVGKTIADVVVVEGDAPRVQAFLVFSDRSYYEFYSLESLEAGGRVYPGDHAHVRRLAGGNHHIVFDTADQQ